MSCLEDNANIDTHVSKVHAVGLFSELGDRVPFLHLAHPLATALLFATLDWFWERFDELDRRRFLQLVQLFLDVFAEPLADFSEVALVAGVNARSQRAFGGHQAGRFPAQVGWRFLHNVRVVDVTGVRQHGHLGESGQRFLLRAQHQHIAGRHFGQPG